MQRLKYDAHPRHVLIEGGERIHGGDEFEVSPKRARELLASRVPVSKVRASKDSEPDSQVEPVSDEATTEADASTPTDE